MEIKYNIYILPLFTDHKKIISINRINVMLHVTVICPVSLFDYCRREDRENDRKLNERLLLTYHITFISKFGAYI